MYNKISAAIFGALLGGDGSGFGKVVFSHNAVIDLAKSSGLPLETGVTGDLPVSNLGKGKNASPSTFWSGEGKWKNPLPIGSMWEFAPFIDHVFLEESGFHAADGSSILLEDYPDLSFPLKRMTGLVTLPIEPNKWVFVGRKGVK